MAATFADCPSCGGYGYHNVTYHVTRDMALDAGEPSMEGEPIHEREQCSECGGAGCYPVENEDQSLSEASGSVPSAAPKTVDASED